MTISGFIDPDNDPSKMWQERPYLDGASKDPSVRVIQNGLVNRNDAAKKIAELRARSAAARRHRVGGRHPALEQDSIHSLFDKLPLMVVLLITTTDDPDVPGVRVGGAADQGRGDERADAGLDDGRAHVDVRRRARLRPDELHPAAADGADDRPDHRGDLGSVDRLRSRSWCPAWWRPASAACPPPRPSGSAPPPPAG